MDFIDISGWHKDEAFSPYPEGSRDKYAVIAPKVSCPPPAIAGHRYLMKFSNKRYPVQFWSEIIARIVGEHIQVPTPKTFIALDPDTGRPGSLIEWFYGPELEHAAKAPAGSGFMKAFQAVFGVKEEAPTTHSLYVPGSSYMTRTIPGYDLKSGTQHNFLDIAIWITLFGRGAQLDFWIYWAKMLLFDAIIGNTDRHQDNWGVLWRADDQGNLIPRFAPAFDNGTSLAHEIMEERLANFATTDAIRKYIHRGRHHMKWQIKDERKAQHFELVERLLRFRPRVREPIRELVNRDFSPAFGHIAELCDVDVEVKLSTARADVICRMIEQRLEHFKKVL